ncbi:hypothetical protein [Chitinophaga sp.]|uniref:hypothetical protein n=1 Tax=Chitinophaga sp. TaxID=1869181 RepID=UPI0031D3EF77
MLRKFIPVVGLVALGILACSKSDKSDPIPVDPKDSTSTGTGPGNPIGSITGDTIALNIKGDSAYFPYVIGMKLNYETKEIWSSKVVGFTVQRVANIVTDTARYVIFQENSTGKDSLLYYQVKPDGFYQFENATSQPKAPALIWKLVDGKADNWVEEKPEFDGVTTCTNKITGRKETVTVGKKVYQNVTRVETVRHFVGPRSEGISKYAAYYAPGIGLIQLATGIDTTKLISITLPK